VAEIGFEDREVEAALAQGIAVMRVLVKNLVEVRSAEIDSGEAVGEVAAWDAYDGAGKQAQSSGELNGRAGCFSISVPVVGKKPHIEFRRVKRTQGLKRLQTKGESRRMGEEDIPQGLKPDTHCCCICGLAEAMPLLQNRGFV
jgi:hypothetical protein